MARNPACTVYIGNLDEKVNDRVLYEILIQVGRLVDLYIPVDKETSRHRGFAFAEYESEEIANYAVRLFSGLVRLHNKNLKFAISGQDKPSQNTGMPVTPQTTTPSPSLRPHAMHEKTEMERTTRMTTASGSCRMLSHEHSKFVEASPLGFGSNGFIASNFEHNRRFFGSPVNDIGSQDSRLQVGYPYY